MDEPKLATARVDAERVVRELLGAFKLLKTMPAPLTCFSPSEEEQPRPPQSQDGRSRAFEVAGGTLSTTSADPSPVPRPPLETLTGAVSDIDEAAPEQISTFEKSTQHEIIEEFRSDHEVIERLRVTPQELQALSSASLLGSLTYKQDVQFMLSQIREAREPASLQATVPPEPLHVAAENIEPSIPDFSEMAERIRRESLAKLNESDSLRVIDRRSTLGQFGVFSSALILMAAMTWSCIKMMVNWRHHLSRKLTLSALSSIGARFGKTGNYKILVSGMILFVASLVVGIYLRRSRYLTQGSGGAI